MKDTKELRRFFTVVDTIRQEVSAVWSNLSDLQNAIGRWPWGQTELSDLLTWLESNPDWEEEVQEVRILCVQIQQLLDMHGLNRHIPGGYKPGAEDEIPL